MNILIIGYCPQRFMNPVAKRLQANGDKVDLTSFTQFDVSKEEASYYNSIHNGSDKNVLFVKVLHFLTGWVLYGSLMLKFLFKNNGYGLFDKSRWVIKALLNHHMTSQVRYYDLVNIQLLADYDAFYPFIMDNTKVVVSYWGSDLLQASDKDLAKQKKWLKRSDIITVQSDELEKALIEKHKGLDIGNKVRKSLYPVNQDIFKTISENLSKKQSDNKVMISIGYNASENQNHLRILDQIDGLSRDLKVGIRLYVHMSYGGSKAYLKAVENKLAGINVAYELNTKFLTDSEMAMKRIASDVFIHLPTTDAFCAALSESLIAENIVITGDWLPYALYEKHNVYMEKVSDINQLADRLEKVIQDFQEKKTQCKNNQNRVLEIVDQERSVDSWYNIFQSTISS